MIVKPGRSQRKGCDDGTAVQGHSEITALYFRGDISKSVGG